MLQYYSIDCAMHIIILRLKSNYQELNTHYNQFNPLELGVVTVSEPDSEDVS